LAVSESGISPEHPAALAVGTKQWRNPFMTHNPNPNDPYRAPDDVYRSADEPYRTNPSSDNVRRQARLDNELQPDPELAEGPASGGKVAMFAVAIALVLGAVFYGLNNSTINQAGTATTAQNSTQTSPPAAPPGMRDVTPRPNTGPGTTTGAAPAQPQTPSPAAPGSDMSRSGNLNAPASK
jgi:hypothetical protein